MSVGIEIKDIGPIEEFSYEMQQPGLHVLVGEQGSGKSTTLRTVELATQGETALKPVKRDGSKNGEATIAGKTLKISRTTREEGELSVEGLGDLDITTLHWPRYEKPEIRDKYRIATMCRLAGLKGSVEDFKAVVTEEDWNTLVGPKVTITDDVVELAMRVKRAIDGAALNVEKLAETSEANAVALTKQFEGVVLESAGEGWLSEAYASAVATQQQMKGAALAAETSGAAVEAAKKSLAMIPAVDVERVQLDVDLDAKASENAHQDTIRANTIAAQYVENVKRELDVAVEKATAAQKHEHAAKEALALMRQSAAEQVTAARQAMEQRKVHEEAIQAALTIGPTLDELAAADEVVDVAQKAMMQGQVVRTAIAAKAEHARHRENTKALRKRADKLRDAAKAALAILGDAIAKIPNCPLKVAETKDGDTRLVVSSDRAPDEFFDELSDGERWKMIVPLCLGPDRLIVLPQAAFGEMAPSTAAYLDGLIRDQKAYVLTARAEDVALQGMPYSEWIKSKE